MSRSETSVDDQKDSEHPLAALYQRYVLDPLIELARTISHDFVARPQHYRALPEDIATILESFRIQTGSSPAWLSSKQRTDVFAPIFGETFASTSVCLRAASYLCVERGEQNADHLLHGVRDAVTAFGGYLRSIEGRAVTTADTEIRVLFQSALIVLRSQAVAAVFGLPASPCGDWPLRLEDAGSSDGAYLIEEIQRALKIYDIQPTMTRHRFILSQNIGHYGAATITAALQIAPGRFSDDQIQNLVANAYAWEGAYRALLTDVDVIRAWKDPRYRETLTPYEESLIPTHPAGKVDLKDALLDPAVAAQQLGLGYTTVTVPGEVCCSTGDFVCTSTAKYSCTRTAGIECGGTRTLKVVGYK